MSRKKKSADSRSWREINQTVNQRAMTSHGRRRRWWNGVRVAVSIFACGAVAMGAWYLYRDHHSPGRTFGLITDETPLQDIVVLTDGTLNETWVRERLALPEGIPLMTVDLEAAKNALESERQVRAAVVARHFPSTLLVTLEERAPIVRIMVPTDPARPETMFVARDGVVYRGYFYDSELESRLPWLDGIRLVRDGDGFAPIAGLEDVSELLLAALQDAPHLRPRFRIVSLAEAPQVLVQIADGPEAVFSPGNFRLQLARLDYVLDLFRQQPPLRGKPGRIDLSLGNQVVVQFDSGAPEEEAATVANYFTRSSFNHQENRDF